MSNLKTAVIGVGALGRHHARILAGMDGVDMIAVCDPNEEQGKAVADQHGLRYEADYRSVLGEIDAASIVVPTGLHRRVAEDCLTNGVHVMVEKPLAGNLDDGSEIVATARRAGLTLSVGHIERFNPTFNDLVEAAGSPRYIKAERFSHYAFRSTDVSAVHDLMIHDIELVQHITQSRVARVEAFGACLAGGFADVIQARLTFESGCIADLSANRVCPDFKRSMQVWSETGCHSADLHNRVLTSTVAGPRTLAGDRPLDCFHAGEPVEDLKAAMFDGFFEKREVKGGDADALTAELAAFVAAARGESSPVVSGEDGLAALAVADKVLQCVENHRWDNSTLIGPNFQPVIANRQAA